MLRGRLAPRGWRGARPRRAMLVGDRGGGSFLPDVFPNARQWVEAAFGADPNADPDTWSWTNITGPSTVQWDPGVNIKIGNPDESLGIVPATLTCTIRNDQPNGGDFTIDNPLGAHYPYIRQNTPIRARLDIGNGPTIRFQGYATSWRPQWSVARRMAVVVLTANGIARRHKQGKAVAKSAIRRHFESGAARGLTMPVAYWSLEDDEGATSAASGLTGGTPMSVTGGGVAGAGARFGVSQGRIQPAYTHYEVPRIATKSFVSLAEGGTLSADLPAGSSTLYRVQFVGFAWTEAPSADIVMVRWFTPGGSFVRYDVVNRASTGFVELVGYSSAGAATTLLSSGFAPVDEFEYAFFFTQNGGNIETDFAISLQLSSGLVGDFLTDSRAGTLKLPTRIQLNPDGATADGSQITGSENQHKDIRFAHLAVWFTELRYITDQTLSPVTGTYYAVMNGWPGEPATTRLTRICAEEGVRIDIAGTSDAAMGFQDSAGFLDLLTQAQAVDQGLLLDGLGPGYTYYTRTQIYSRPADITLNYGDITGPDNPEQDDQGRVNDYTANDPLGSFARFVQTAGDFGTNAADTYDDSGDHRTYYAADLYQIAAWRVAQGTVGGLRYPTLEFELAEVNTSIKAQQWLDARPSYHFRVLNLSANPGNPHRSFVLRGWNERWNSKIWHVTANLTPYDAFAVTRLADDAGTDNGFVAWIDTDGSTVATGINAGDTSLVVNVSGQVWTNVTTPSPNYADDISGLYINLDGMRVGVTGISGSSSPQTFSLVGADVLRAVPVGASVSVWTPFKLGL